MFNEQVRRFCSDTGFRLNGDHLTLFEKIPFISSRDPSNEATCFYTNPIEICFSLCILLT